MDIQLATTRIPLPAPRVAINIRPATMDDLPFIDELQDMHTKQVGFLPTKALEGKIRLGHILVAWASCPRVGETPTPQGMREEPVGYLIGNDQYNKRDDLGIIYQMNVVPGKQRALIGASLLKAQFERSAYGCKLYCCWCAQDLAANRFWEACGFVPLAFRTGARSKGKNAAGKGVPRMHIFWQKRIREGDTTTPWWFPSQTSGGAMMEDRLVLPIPFGVHWSDAMPILLPGAEVRDQKSACPELAEREVGQQKRIAGPKAVSSIAVQPPPSKQLMGSGFISFDKAKVACHERSRREKPATTRVKEPKTKTKNDPKYIAAARELRDRWLERVNENPMLLASDGKYDVARQLESSLAPTQQALPLLTAA